jgi:hypothetical protein
MSAANSAAANPATSSPSHRTRPGGQRTRPSVRGVRTRTASRTATAEVSGSVCGRTGRVPAPAAGAAMPAGHRPCSPHLERPWPAVAAVTGRGARPRVARVAMAAGLAQRPPVVHTGGWWAVGGRTPVRAAARRGHRHGYRPQPGHVCRTPAVRTALVPEAADGQSAARPAR